MPKRKQTAAELRASGSRHYSKKQLEEREAGEVRPGDGTVAAPSYLPQGLRIKFERLAETLVPLGVLTQLNADSLARYLIAESNYLYVSDKLTSALNRGDMEDAVRLSAMQDRFFRQCRAVGSDFGLSVATRLHLPESDGRTEGDDLFGD